MRNTGFCLKGQGFSGSGYPRAASPSTRRLISPWIRPMAHHTSGWAKRAAAYAAPVPSRAGRDRAGGNVAPPPRRVSPAPGRRDGEHSGPPPQGGRGPEGVLSYRMWREGGVSAREVLLTSFLQWSVCGIVSGACIGRSFGFTPDSLWFCFGFALVLLRRYSGVALEFLTSEEGITPEGGTHTDTVTRMQGRTRKLQGRRAWARLGGGCAGVGCGCAWWPCGASDVGVVKIRFV